MSKYPSHCCQNCGENIGYLGIFFMLILGNLVHKCKK